MSFSLKKKQKQNIFVFIFLHILIIQNCVGNKDFYISTIVRLLTKLFKIFCDLQLIVTALYMQLISCITITDAHIAHETSIFISFKND